MLMMAFDSHAPRLVLPSAATFLRWGRRRLSRLVRDRRGMSAVEFAMILPLLVTLWLGVVEVTQGVSIDRKLTLTARTVADLAAQVQSVDTTSLATILSASTTIMTPYPTSTLKVTLSSVVIDQNSKATIEWSDTFQGTKRSKGSTVTLPAALNVANTSLIWGEVAYDYTPTVGYVVTGTLNLTDQIYMRPRLSDKVTCTNC
jgi:Flp pilus assembly protein TadG